jgi:hopene-associated glycosyltransferase HpnB
MVFIVCLATIAWIALLLLPWRPWGTKERLDSLGEQTNLSDVAVVIPARNEAPVIGRTMQALNEQGANLSVVLVDDQSSDNTAQYAKGNFSGRLEIVRNDSLPDGWTGKLWALNQGLQIVKTPLVLFLDADIELERGMIATLRKKMLSEELDLVSIMASLRMESFWEKLLIPAFIYFFKLIYPFALGNSRRSRMGVAAGGCILVRRDTLRKIGGLESIRGALIDDCTLARRVKDGGGRIWIGLSHSVRSHRAYIRLSEIWSMVARTAFTQLRSSSALLIATTLLMLLLFWIPWLGVFSGSLVFKLVSIIGIVALIAAYLPTLRYYRKSPAWALMLPVIATFYLLMTWSSAIRSWRGRRSEWKGRVYR